MKKGDKVALYMKKTLEMGGAIDDCVYSCEVLKYNKSEERIYLIQESGKLTDLSLDAIYECRIQTERECYECTGRIKERYIGDSGKTINLEIKNGFYKKI